jgi:hypothetical protein
MAEPVHISQILPEAIRRIRWRGIRAKFDSIATCGHNILAGDEIGYDRDTHDSRCRECFENIREREGREKQETMNQGMKVE